MSDAIQPIIQGAPLVAAWYGWGVYLSFVVALAAEALLSSNPTDPVSVVDV